MSDNWINIIPQDPHWIPGNDIQVKIAETLKLIMPQSENITLEISDEICFRDCGQNFETIKCPNCKNDLSIDNWHKIMELDYTDNGFKMEKYELDCCGTLVNLNELKYEFHQGFSRFIASCMNPNKGELAIEEISQIEKVMTTKIAIIYQHI